MVTKKCAKQVVEVNTMLLNDIMALYHRLRYRKNADKKLRQRACIVKHILTEMKTLDSSAREDHVLEASQANVSRGGDSVKSKVNKVCIEKEKRKRKKPKKHNKKSNKKH